MRSIPAVVAIVAATFVGGVAPAAAEGPIDPEGYWTEQKLRAAASVDEWPTEGREPAEQLAETSATAPGEAGTGQHDNGSTGALGLPRTAPHESSLLDRAVLNNKPVPSVGKLFFSTPTGDTSCTATVVKSGNKSTIITAGHCVSAGGAGKPAYNNFLFAPAYNNGPSSYGYWSFVGIGLSIEWAKNKNWTYDYGFITLAPNSKGQSIETVTGGHAITTSASQASVGTHVWGYPALAPYDGKSAKLCVTNTARINSYATDARASCDFTEGASGGPWLTGVSASSVGTVWAVSSRCDMTSGSCSALFATPLPDAALVHVR